MVVGSQYAHLISSLEEARNLRGIDVDDDVAIGDVVSEVFESLLQVHHWLEYQVDLVMQGVLQETSVQGRLYACQPYSKRNR